MPQYRKPKKRKVAYTQTDYDVEFPVADFSGEYETTLPPYDPDRQISARSIVDDDLRGLLYGLVEPAMSHNIDDQHLGGMLDIRLPVAGAADFLGKKLSKTQEPSLGDAGMAALDVAAFGSGQLLKQGVRNLRNKVSGFYGGSEASRVAGVGANVGRLPVDMAREAINPLASGRASRGLSQATHDVLKTNLAKYDELVARGKASGFTDDLKAELRDAARTISGQLNQNVVHNVMMGQDQKILGEWGDAHFRNINAFDRGNAKAIFGDDVDADLLFDMTQGAWGGLKAPVYVEKRGAKEGSSIPSKVIGDSHRDIFSSRQFNTLRRLSKLNEDAGTPLRTRDDWITALDKYDPNWSKNIAINPKNIVEGANGVMFQFSPAGKADYLLGGFNAIVKMDHAGNAKFFGSDKQDIFGQGIPGAADAIVGIGTSSRRVGWKTKTEIGKQPPVYKSPPRATPDGARSADKTIKDKKKKKKKEGGDRNPNYISQRERQLMDNIMGVSAAPPSSYYARTGGLIGVGSLDED